jgi:hypothetical protein
VVEDSTGWGFSWRFIGEWGGGSVWICP